jgi:D-arginine dehydrogenase
MSHETADFIVIGAGIGGASVAYWLSAKGARDRAGGRGAAGYHSTGRSAALFMESYGPDQVRALTPRQPGFLPQSAGRFLRE